MQVSIRYTSDRFSELSRRIPGATQFLAERFAHRIARTAKDSMTGSHSGRLYVRAGKIHQASAPGEPPAIDTSNLSNSIQVESTRTGAIVYSTAEYAAYLEFGTSHMGARPFFAPAVEQEAPRFERDLAQLEREIS